MLDAHAERDLGGSDVRREGEDFRPGQHAVLRVIVADVEFSVAQRGACIERGVEVELAAVEPHRECQRLEGRAQFEHTGGEPVNARRVARFPRIVRIEIRHRHHRDDFAGAHVGDQSGRGLGLELVARGQQLVAHRVLDPQIDCELYRLLQPVGREPGGVERREPIAVDPFLHSGDALIIDIHQADQMRDLGAVGINALVLVEKADARNAEPINILLLLRRDLALEPGKAALLVAEAIAHVLGVEVGHYGGRSSTASSTSISRFGCRTARMP